MFDKRDTPCRFIDCHYKPGSEHCKGCGWDMDEHAARVKALREEKMVRNEQGLLTLHVMGKGKEDGSAEALL